MSTRTRSRAPEDTLDFFTSAPPFTIARCGAHRTDGRPWGWRSLNGYWLWFDSEDAARAFNDTYRRLYPAAADHPRTTAVSNLGPGATPTQ